MTVKCVSMGGCEIHVVNHMIYLSLLIYVCHLSLQDFFFFSPENMLVLKLVFQLSLT